MITIRDEKVLNWLSRFSYAHAAIAVPKLKKKTNKKETVYLQLLSCFPYAL